MTDAASRWIFGAIGLAQIIAGFWLLTRRMTTRQRTMIALAGLAAVVVIVFYAGLPARSMGLGAAGLCHAAAYSGLLLWFLGSLREGREPVITGFARQLRQTMPVAVVRYTRWATVAWCAFFAAQLLISACLLAAAPRDVWSCFVQLLNVPLVVGMMLAEFGVRRILFRREMRTDFSATVAGLRRIRGLSRSQ